MKQLVDSTKKLSMVRLIFINIIDMAVDRLFISTALADICLDCS